jgi:Fe-S cluster assembly iron-binding protein IscA
MVTVTAGAMQELGKMLTEANVDDPEVGLRVVQNAPGEFSLMLDKEHEKDQVVDNEGAKVLFIGNDLSEALDGVTIDFKETPEGSRLVMSKK